MLKQAGVVRSHVRVYVVGCFSQRGYSMCTPAIIKIVSAPYLLPARTLGWDSGAPSSRGSGPKFFNLFLPWCVFTLPNLPMHRQYINGWYSPRRNYTVVTESIYRPFLWSHDWGGITEEERCAHSQFTAASIFKHHNPFFGGQLSMKNNNHRRPAYAAGARATDCAWSTSTS